MRPPAVDVIVAAHNEAGTIEGKLHNLAAIDYPASLLRIIIVDGASTDGTAAAASAAAAGAGPAVTVLQAGQAGKARQLNLGIAAGDAPWILVTDADARLEPAALREMLRAAERTGAAVVGAPVAVRSTFVPEQIHWWLSNLLRFAEDRVCGSAGLVVGPCYLVRRELVGAFPVDAIADDLFVACRAAAAQARVVVAGPLVSDLRAAAGPIEFVRHKYRKATFYLTEVARAVPALGGRPGAAARAFQVRLLLMAALPLAALAVLALGFAAWAAAPGVTTIAAGVLLSPGIGLRLPAFMRALGGVSWVVLTGLVLLAAVASWPFRRPHPAEWRPRLNDPGQAAS